MVSENSSLQPAPDFVLPTQAGGEFHLASHIGMSVIVAVFYRGHWCPFCRRYLCKLQQRLGDIEAAGGKLIAISPEPPSAGAALASDLGLTFPLLSDLDGNVIDRFGTRNSFSSTRSLLPHAAVFVIDLDGMIRLKSIDRNYKKRTTIRTIIRAIEECREA